MNPKCYICGTELACYAGCSAHPSNWYCPNTDCPTVCTFASCDDIAIHPRKGEDINGNPLVYCDEHAILHDRRIRHPEARVKIMMNFATLRVELAELIDKVTTMEDVVLSEFNSLKRDNE
jgi:hypothetical protein